MIQFLLCFFSKITQTFTKIANSETFLTILFMINFRSKMKNKFYTAKIVYKKVNFFLILSQIVWRPKSSWKLMTISLLLLRYYFHEFFVKIFDVSNLSYLLYVFAFELTLQEKLADYGKITFEIVSIEQTIWRQR